MTGSSSPSCFTTPTITFTGHHILHDQGKLYVPDYTGAEPAFVLMHGCSDKLHLYIWGKTNSYLNVGVAEDFRQHLQHPALHLLPARRWMQMDMPGQAAAIMLTAL